MHPLFEKQVLRMVPSGRKLAKRLRTEEEQPRRPFVAKRQTSSKASCDEGAIAQLVEQRTENPCVTGSIPVGTTKKETFGSLFLYL